MLSEYEAAKLSNDAGREPYPSPASVFAAVAGTVLIIVAAVFGDVPAPAPEVQAPAPRVSAAIAHSRLLYEERRARFEQARSGGAPLPKSYSVSTVGTQEVADQQAEMPDSERRNPSMR